MLRRRPPGVRLAETLRFLADEIEARRVGGLGEAQAAGYLAGRLGRAEQQTTILGFRSDADPRWLLAALGGGIALALALPLALPERRVVALSALVVLVVLGLWLDEYLGGAVLRQVLGRRDSQSVVGVRAASLAPRWRAVIVAPLDGAPPAPSPVMVRLVFAGLVLLLAVYGGLSWNVAWAWHIPAIGLSAAVLLGFVGIAWAQRMPVLARHGTGELAALLGSAEEVGQLRQVEVWTVAAGGSVVGEAGLRKLLRQYPFDGTTVVINLHHITNGAPVYVTREGLLRLRRSPAQLLALAAHADADDARINAEPRALPSRTLAQFWQRNGFAAITLTSHHGVEAAPADVELATVQRCVWLVVGMLRALDETSIDQMYNTGLSKEKI